MQNLFKMKKLLVIMWIYTNVICMIFCQNQTTDDYMAKNGSSSIGSSPTADLTSIPISSIADNRTNLNGPDATVTNGFMLKMPSGIPLRNVSKSSWTIPIPIEETRTDSEHILFTESGQPVLDLSILAQYEASIKNETKNGDVNQIDTNKMRILNNVPNESSAKDYEAMVGTEQLNVTGTFTPLETLSRQKRQSDTRSNDPLRNRVLLLTNNDLNGTLNQRLDGRVLMLMRQPNVTGQGMMGSNATMRLKPRDSIFDVFLANSRHLDNPRLSEVTRSLPAMQRITDLNNIELPLLTSEFTHTNNNSMNASRNASNHPSQLTQRLNELQSANSQASRRTNPRNVTSSNRLEGATRQNFQNQNRQQNNRQPTNRQPTRQLVSLRHSQNNRRPVTRRPQNRMSSNTAGRTNRQSSRQSTSNSGTRPRRPVQPRLTVQQPVNSQRISAQPTSSRSSSSTRRITRPLVRAISSQNIRQQSQRNRASQPRQRINNIRRQPRRQMVRRRRPSPSDPFTRRFAAGFQRGSNLLNQPPLDFTGFDGSVRENVGFNGLSANELRLPGPLLTQTPRRFGGLPLPGFGFGPTMI